MTTPAWKFSITENTKGVLPFEGGKVDPVDLQEFARRAADLAVTITVATGPDGKPLSLVFSKEAVQA